MSNDAVSIPFRDPSKALLEKLKRRGVSQFGNSESISSISIDDMKTFFEASTDSKDKKARFLIERLKTLMLSDLSASLGIAPASKKSSSILTKMEYAALILSGIFLAVAEGYDSISSMLAIFGAAIPLAATISLGVVSSLLSVAVFLGFDLHEISKNLGVSLWNSRRLLDIYLERAAEIDRIMKHIESNLGEDETKLDEFKNILAILQSQLDQLKLAREQYKTKENSVGYKAAKFCFALVCGVLFFGAGYFAGQAFALSIAAAALTAPQILVPALIIGLASFMIYWFVERPGVEKLMGRLFGLNPHKIEAFVGEDATRHEEQQQKLTDLSERIKQKEEVIQLTEKIKQLEGLKPSMSAPIPTPISDQDKIERTSSYGQAFFSPSPSPSDKRGTTQSSSQVSCSL